MVGSSSQQRQTGVDSAPAGADQVHEKREVVYACVALGEQIPFDPLQSPNRLVEQAADLGNVASHREHLGAETVAHGDTDLNRN